MKSRTYSTGVNWTGLLPAFITALPQNPIKALRGILKGKPSMAQALVEERKQEVECKVAIS